MNEIDHLVSRLCDPVAFATEHCDWSAGDYCFCPVDVIYDAAVEEILEWAEESEVNLQALKAA